MWNAHLGGHFETENDGGSVQTHVPLTREDELGECAPARKELENDGMPLGVAGRCRVRAYHSGHPTVRRARSPHDVSRRQRIVVQDPAAAAAERIADQVRAGGHVVLTGGGTPKDAYERVAAIEDLDWSDTTLWFGDERCVEPGDELSNYSMAKSALLDRIDGPAPTVLRMRGELGPDQGAAAYADDLRSAFGAGTPRFDLLLLGLGPDTHIASMFPGKPAIEVRDRLVVGVPEAGFEPFVPRITMTLPVINAARAVLFLVAGEDKAEAVARAFGDQPPGLDRPASNVAPDDGELTLILDPAAGRG